MMASMKSRMRPPWGWLLLLGALFLTGCGGGGGDDVIVAPSNGSLPGGGTVTPPATARQWSQARSFAYQLQAPNLGEIQASGFDIVVIDYSRDGSAEGRYTADEIAALKQGSNGKRRLVLGYFSIGEAEEYRYYWQPGWTAGNPSWLDQENPNWPGNYKVRYWDPEWRAILFGSPSAYLDQILAAGFDGVYLDIIDAYEYYENQGDTLARGRMEALVADIATYGRARSGSDFGVFPQNGEALLEDDDYLAVITGLGKEDTYYGYDGDNVATPADVTAQIERLAGLVVGAGKVVLNIDYTDVPAQIQDAHGRAAARGFLEYTGPRALDDLVVIPGLQPRP